MNTEPDDRTNTTRSGTTNRVASALAWYTPELTGAAVAGAAATTVWAPLGAVSAALAAWIAADQVTVARARRRARREVEQRAERAQLDSAERDGEANDDTEHDQRSGDVGAVEHVAGGRPGREVAG